MRNPLHHCLIVTARRIAAIPRSVAIMLIGLYQATLSPDHGPLRWLYPHGCCLHEPTCSEYGKQVIAERGVLIGSWLTLKRLLTCNPWSAPSPERAMDISSAHTKTGS